MQLTKEQKLSIYRKMTLIRASELKMVELFKKGAIVGHMLPCLGQEAIAATFSEILREEDFLITGHRGGGHYIARGCDFDAMWAELYGKADGITKGRGGQIHLMDISKNAITGNAIVAAQWGIAAGAGFAAKNKGVMAACFGGEGSTNRGPFHESLNMAAVLKMPVLFVVEFNNKQMWNTAKEILSVERVADRAVGYGIKGITVDGDDPNAIYEAASELAKEIRSGSGPALMECITHKWTDSVSNVRDLPENVEKFKTPEMDPIQRFEKVLLEERTATQEMLEEIRAASAQRLQQALDFAQNSPLPDKFDGIDQVYCPSIVG